MLPAFVIGLREGVEASLIVGIVAAFLVREGRRDALRSVWLGVALAVALCLAVGVGLQVAEENLPQQEQERLETVIALIAVGMVTYMIVWMRQHASQLKTGLEEQVATALQRRSARALVLTAFLAVLREGFETAVFLLAAFQASSNAAAAAGGAVLGILLAVVIGYGIYRGGVRINLGRFFRITGVLLVFVAAGLLASAAHTAHEAGWLNILQQEALDLRWLVDPGSVRAALLTGMFGIQGRPTVAEILAWLLYAIPVGVLVFLPVRRRITPPRPAAVTA